MRLPLFFLFFCFILSAYSKSIYGNSPSGYHELIGIRRAREIQLYESSRIVGGSPVSALSEHPHQAGIVTLLTTGWTSICGGSLVSATKVLTAAHCWWDGSSQATQFTIVLGSLTVFAGGTRIVTKNVVVHPNWNVENVVNDIAMVTITRVSFSNSIRPISLPAASDVNRDFSGLVGTATGFGKVTDAQSSFPTTTSLHHLNVNVMTNQACQSRFDLTVQGSWMCTDGAGGRGTCDGDSGGPLTVVWNNERILVGIVSFGLADGCQSNFPSVYTRVTSFLSWINSQL